MVEGGGGLAGAEGGDGGAVVGFAETVFEAVLSVAVGATGTRVLDGVDGGFAVGFCALGWSQAVERRCAACDVIDFAHGVFPSVLRPFAGVSTFVGYFGAVIEAEGGFARVAAEGEEVELMAVGELAVGAD